MGLLLSKASRFFSSLSSQPNRSYLVCGVFMRHLSINILDNRTTTLAFPTQAYRWAEFISKRL